MNPYKDLFGQVERTYVQVSRLLQDADQLMDEAGVPEIGKGSQVGWTASGAITTPAGWFPGWMSRHYRLPGDAPGMAYVSVLLYNREIDDMKALDAPVVSAGVWRLTGPKLHWYYWMAKCWAWSRRPADGSVQRFPFSLNDIEASVATLAVPLGEVASVDQLSERVVGPLVEEVRRVG